MNGLELDEYQVNRLLVMAKFVFRHLEDEAKTKSYEFSGKLEDVENNRCGFYLTKNYHVCCSYPEKIEYQVIERSLMRMHWFEFCVTKLGPIIMDSLYDFVGDRGLKLKDHPVDVLYEKFCVCSSEELRYLVKMVKEGKLP